MAQAEEKGTSGAGRVADDLGRALLSAAAELMGLAGGYRRPGAGPGLERAIEPGECEDRGKGD